MQHLWGPRAAIGRNTNLPCTEMAKIPARAFYEELVPVSGKWYGAICPEAGDQRELWGWGSNQVASSLSQSQV